MIRSKLILKVPILRIDFPFNLFIAEGESCLKDDNSNTRLQPLFYQLMAKFPTCLSTIYLISNMRKERNVESLRT